MSQQPHKNGQKGFTLLLAALVASIVLALGSSIFLIAQKQVTLSSIGRDSQFAFYAADTVAECALYWDFRYGYFGTTTPSNAQNPTCDGVALNVTTTAGDPSTFPSVSTSYTKTSALINLFSDAVPVGNFCTQIAVTKSYDSSASAVRTVIHADGYSVDCNSIDVNPRALQRSVELHY